MDPNVPNGAQVCVPQLHANGPSPRYSAFEKTLPEMAALDAKDLITINVDVPTVTAGVLARLPGLRALRPTIEAELPKYDLAKFDDLERIALAVQHAHARYVAASTPPSELIALSDEGMKLREQLRADGNALAAHGLIDARSLADVKGAPGYRNIAVELMVLTTLFRGHTETISGKTVVDSAMLDRADAVADQLLLAAAAHEQAPTKIADAVQTRQRAFTVFAHRYDHVRRAVTYLRWNDGDVDTIAPSLYAGRTSRRADDKADAKDAAAPAADSPVPAAEPASPPAPVPVGMPGGSPYVS